MRQILFVDDEPRILEGLRKSLRIHRTRWNPQFAESGAAALALMETQPFDAVVTDARMPKMGGAELLEQVQRRAPGTLRFVLSGQADQGATHRFALLAHQFFSKPTPSADLVERVERACHLAELLIPPTLRGPLAGLTTLPEFPWLYNRLRQELEGDAPSVAALTRILAQGPALAARALHLTNSAFFGWTRPVTTLHEAASLLGADGCRMLLASVVPLVGDGRMLDELGRRVVSFAQLAAAACATRADAETAYTAGLLSQLGTVVLVHGAGTHYAQVWAEHLSGAALEDREAARFGVSHLTTGAALLGLWNAPGALIDAVGLHTSDPASVTDEGITCALRLAHAVDAEQRASQGPSAAVTALAATLALEPRLAGLRQLAREAQGVAG